MNVGNILTPLRVMAYISMLPMPAAFCLLAFEPAFPPVTPLRMFLCVVGMNSILAWMVWAMAGEGYIPMSWRLASPRLDKLLCRLNSHRIRYICARGCCSECIRCEAERKGELAEHYARLRKLLSEG